MVRFLYITDTHLGSNGAGFQQQPAYPDQLGHLLDGIRHILKEESEIDFILHGGDMVHGCSEHTIEMAREAFQFDVPLYLSVGNHDLDRPDAAELWLKHAPGFFASGKALDYQVQVNGVMLHVMPNQWDREQLYYWKQAQDPFYTEDQMRRLEADIRRDPDLIHLLAVHNPVFGVMPEQTGLMEVIHEVDSDFRRYILDLMDRYPQLKCVLSGHNHINSLYHVEGGLLLSSSSLIETPFEYKIIEINQNRIQVETRSLPIQSPLKSSQSADFMPDYRVDRSYVQGRRQDREAVFKWE
ncbi:metallophosphoesterase family protein [Paenibacillus dakarensis]|uniref:metallophosphoesterase family protein n=1 Tax=Paenibacillus dakarensis TaxID=1527293 RepID=UPI0006D53DED|nr:metallophosphoesterase [Paenibacillus dakarensis]